MDACDDDDEMNLNNFRRVGIESWRPYTSNKRY